MNFKIKIVIWYTIIALSGMVVAFRPALLASASDQRIHQLSEKYDCHGDAMTESRDDLENYEQLSFFEDYFPPSFCVVNSNSVSPFGKLLLSDITHPQSTLLHDRLRRVLFPFHSFW